MRARDEHGRAILPGRPRSRDQARELAGLVELEVAVSRVLDAVHGVVAMQRLARRTWPNVECQTGAQKRVDRVLLDALLSHRAERVLQDVRAEALQHRRLAEGGDGAGFADQPGDRQCLFGDDGESGLLGRSRECAVGFDVVFDQGQLVARGEVGQDHAAVLLDD